jgi:DNA-binding transcriptional ArsR family regulator
MTTVAVFSAIGDARRRRILELLAERERSVGELTTLLEIAQPSVTQHLAVLREAGLVSVEKRGTSSIYSLERGALGEVTAWVESLR